ncbi:MAG TPA: methyltransferase domain-containing protein [Candidatus Hodarchaeales archaeon]|nr:methyltransferase domain-containing protein [Candidatus Hodarchaeales archaeon]
MNKEEKLLFANTEPRWMYEFDLGDEVKTPLLIEELRSVHETREKAIFPIIDRLYPDGLGGRQCLDVACNEGYFSHLLYRRGAVVKGVDIRDLNIQRAKKIQEIYGLSHERLSFEVRDFLLNQDSPATYEIVFFLGLLYHLEDPMGALRILYRISRALSVVDTQLTRQNNPVVTGWGQTSVTLELPASIALLQQEDSEINNLASWKNLSFIPNAAAVRQMLFSAGFSNVVQVAPPPGSNPQYLNNDRGIFMAFK